MRYTTDGTYKENLKRTASLYVVVIPHGIGEAVLISLTTTEEEPILEKDGGVIQALFLCV